MYMIDIFSILFEYFINLFVLYNQEIQINDDKNKKSLLKFDRKKNLNIIET